MREILLSFEILELTSLINFIDSSKLLIDKLDGSWATVETSPSSKIIENLVVLLVLKNTRRFFLFKYSFLRLILRNSARCFKSILLWEFFLFFFFFIKNR